MSGDATRTRRLLLIEDDTAFLRRMTKNLEASGFEVSAAESVEDARRILAEQEYDLILTDIRLPGASGLDLLDELREAEGDEADRTPVAVLTSINTVDTAVEAMRRGAADYLTKEATRDEIVMRLRNILDRAELASENRRLRSTLNRYDEFNEIVGVSAAIARVKEQIKEIPSSDVTELIQGPSERRQGARRTRPAPRLAPSARSVRRSQLAPRSLTRIFSSASSSVTKRGAFTGAVSLKRGRFRDGDGGTLSSTKSANSVRSPGPLLKVVETLEFHRLGSERPIRANCRLLFATNKDLAQEVKAGNFRGDLYYRMNIYPIEVPPLRARLEDIAPLARFFAARFAEKHGLEAPTFSEEALSMLRANSWPGNIRELRNVIERLAIRFRGREITTAELAELNIGGNTTAGGAVLLPEGGIDLEKVEQELVIQALERADWNQRRAAQLLGISVDRMNARVKKFNLKHPSWRVHKD